MKLKPEELEVSSFITGVEQDVFSIDATDPNDPTPATWCRICNPVNDSDAC